MGYGYRPSRVLWLLAALLVLVAASLELPASQATLRATNGNGDVYVTSGLLTTSAGPTAQNTRQQGTSLPADPCGDGEVRCFSPVLYAIDTVVPLITLDQRSTWYARVAMRLAVSVWATSAQFEAGLAGRRWGGPPA